MFDMHERRTTLQWCANVQYRGLSSPWHDLLSDQPYHCSRESQIDKNGNPDEPLRSLVLPGNCAVDDRATNKQERAKPTTKALCLSGWVAASQAARAMPIRNAPLQRSQPAFLGAPGS